MRSTDSQHSRMTRDIGSLRTRASPSQRKHIRFMLLLFELSCPNKLSISELKKEDYFPISIDFAEESIHVVNAVYIEVT